MQIGLNAHSPVKSMIKMRKCVFRLCLVFLNVNRFSVPGNKNLHTVCLTNKMCAFKVIFCSNLRCFFFIYAFLCRERFSQGQTTSVHFAFYVLWRSTLECRELYFPSSSISSQFEECRAALSSLTWTIGRGLIQLCYNSLDTAIAGAKSIFSVMRLLYRVTG